MIFNGASQKIIQAIIKGLVKVGNAAKLDGHGAEYYAPLERVIPQTMPSGTNLNNCIESGVYFFNGSATNYVNVPSASAHNGILRVDKWEQDGAVRIVQIYTTCNSTIMYFRTSFSLGSWSGWQTLFTTAGGTVEAASASVAVKSTTTGRQFSFVSDNIGRMGLYDNYNGKWVLQVNTDNTVRVFGITDGNLPLTGGTLKGMLAFETASGAGTSKVFSSGANAYLRNFPDKTQATKFTEIRIEDEKAYLGIDKNDGVGTRSSELLHTGNSAKTVISSTAPSDTSALWIDTSA